MFGILFTWEKDHVSWDYPEIIKEWKFFDTQEQRNIYIKKIRLMWNNSKIIHLVVIK